MKALAVRTRPSATQLLARVLDTPDLADQLRALPAPALAKLVEHVGLEDAGELVALATTGQLEAVFDEDLWQNARPGAEERFDAGRFLVWLEALLEAGDELVAERLSELSEDLLALAFSRQLLVFAVETLMAELDPEAEEGELAEKALSNHLSEEFDEFVVVARRPEGWDTLLAALLALDRDHHALLTRLLARCAAASESYVDDQGGLHAALNAAEMLESDAAGDRESRRAAAGYVAPRDAAAFLKLARAVGETPLGEHDPLTRAYFRELDRTRASRATHAARPRTELFALLQASGVVEKAAPRLLSAGDGDSASRAPDLVLAMQALRTADPGVFAQRSEELAYLANVLVAAATFGGRRVRPIEAVRAVLAICDRGLARVLAPPGTSSSEAPLEALLRHPADGLFRAGFIELGPVLGTGVPDIAKL
ncbi:MAG TPA: DUF6178 family protein [Polyangiaceae bacterium]